MINREPKIYPKLSDMTTSEKSAWEQREIRYDGVAEVSTEWLVEWFPHFRVIDIRQKEELRSPLGHIDHVENIEMNDLLEESQTWDREVPLVLLCRSGGRTAYMSQILQQLGFQEVASVRGGMHSWREEGLSVSFEM